MLPPVRQLILVPLLEAQEIHGQWDPWQHHWTYPGRRKEAAKRMADSVLPTDPSIWNPDFSISQDSDATIPSVQCQNCKTFQPTTRVVCGVCGFVGLTPTFWGQDFPAIEQAYQERINRFTSELALEEDEDFMAIEQEHGPIQVLPARHKKEVQLSGRGKPWMDRTRAEIWEFVRNKYRRITGNPTG